MGKLFSIQIITPSNVVFEGKVEKLFLTSATGEIEILANHENMIISTVPAVTRYIDEEGNAKKLFLSSSIIHVLNDNVKICTDAAEFPNEIDFKRAEMAKQRALDRLKNVESYEKDIYELSLRRAVERLKLKED